MLMLSDTHADMQECLHSLLKRKILTLSLFELCDIATTHPEVSLNSITRYSLKYCVTIATGIGLHIIKIIIPACACSEACNSTSLRAGHPSWYYHHYFWSRDNQMR